MHRFSQWFCRIDLNQDLSGCSGVLAFPHRLRSDVSATVDDSAEHDTCVDFQVIGKRTNVRYRLTIKVSLVDLKIFLNAAFSFTLLAALASCGSSKSGTSKPVLRAGDTLSSACPEVMELMKQGGDGIEKADQEKDFTNPAYLDGLASVVKRLDEIEVRIKADHEAILVQSLANGFAKIIEEHADEQALSDETVKLFVSATREVSAACIDLLL